MFSQGLTQICTSVCTHYLVKGEKTFASILCYKKQF